MKTALIHVLLALLVIVPSSGCGTLLFRERQKGEQSGRLDPNVLILDSLGLLLFILPGLVAFGVDFYTEAIYLPHGVEKGEGPFIHDPDRGDGGDED